VLRGELRSISIAPPQDPERPRSFAQMLFRVPARCLEPRFSVQILRPASVVLVVFFIGLLMAANPETIAEA
jgi:hypothetical protein